MDGKEHVKENEKLVLSLEMERAFALSRIPVKRDTAELILKKKFIIYLANQQKSNGAIDLLF